MRSFVKKTNHKFEDLTEKQKQILLSIDTTVQQFNYVDQINIVKPLPSLDDPMNDHWNSMGAGITNFLDKYSFHPLITLFAKSLDAVNHNQPELFNKSIERILAYHELRSPLVTRFAKGELLFNEVTLEQWRMHRYDPSIHYYKEHIDAISFHTSKRMLMMLYYLNTVEEGGETLFESIDKFLINKYDRKNWSKERK